MKPESLQAKDFSLEKFLTLDGEMKGTVHYVELGHGEPLVLLPSLWTTTKSYRILGKELAQHYHVYIPNLYRGKSTFSRNARTLEDYVTGLDAFINGLHLQSPYLIGVSMSGLLASRYVHEHPSTIKKLYLVSTSPIPVELKNKKTILLSGYAKLLYHNMFSSDGIKTNALWVTDGLSTLVKHPRQMVHDGLIAIADYTHKPDAMPVPTKLLFAGRDEYIPARTVDLMKHVKNLEIEEVDRYHGWFFQHEEELAQKIVDFFSSE